MGERALCSAAFLWLREQVLANWDNIFHGIVAQAGVSVRFEPHRHHYAKARQGDSQHCGSVWFCACPSACPLTFRVRSPCGHSVR